MEGYNWFELYENNALLRKRYLVESPFKVYFFGMIRITRLLAARFKSSGSSKIAVYFTMNQKKALEAFCDYDKLDISLEDLRFQDYMKGLFLCIIMSPIILIYATLNGSAYKARKFIVNLVYYTISCQNWRVERLVVSSNLTPVERCFIQAIKSSSPNTVIWLIPHGAWMKSYTSIYFEDIVLANSYVSHKFYYNQARAKVLLNKPKIKKKIAPYGNNKLGLSLNGNTCKRKLEYLLSCLREPILIKMHPNMGQLNFDLYEHELFTGTLSEFFDDIGIHICGNSTMHLDAIYNGVFSLFADLDDMNDEYNFLSSGLVERFDKRRFLDISAEEIYREVHKQRSRYEVAY
jgi:hypothetical protein